MDRRKFLKGLAVGAGAVATAGFTTNLSAKTRKTLKIALSWPKTLPIMGEGAQFFAKRVGELSGGSLQVKIFGAGELVPALQVFDACSRGLIDGFHSGPYYWKGKNSAFSLFTAYPFGMVADEMMGWLDFGGGMELWRELYAKYNLIPFKGGNTGNQMGGWFRKPIKSLKDLKGLKMRIPGLGGEVMAKLGVKPVNIPGGEIYTALERGTIDATEWVGPALDIKMGFYKVAKYYYSGWHEPGTNLELTFNLKKFKKLSKEEQAIIETAANEMNARMLAQFQYENGVALQKILKGNYGVKLGYFPDDVNEAAKKAIKEILEENAKKNKDFAKVYDSIQKYFNPDRLWTDVGMKWFLDVRDKGVKIGDTTATADQTTRREFSNLGNWGFSRS
jgi:TRAP-type mannitol/chloroaromatic compound transport system substrate-binding protein